MILRDQCTFLTPEACATLWWPCIWRDFRSDKPFTFTPIAHEWIHFVIIIDLIRIRTNGSTPILILCFRFFVAFIIRITDKWNLSFSIWVLPFVLSYYRSMSIDLWNGRLKIPWVDKSVASVFLLINCHIMVKTRLFRHILDRQYKSSTKYLHYAQVES